MIEAIMEATVVMVSKAVLILWIGVVAADLPEEWVELVVKAILTHVPKNLDLLDVCLEPGRLLGS